MPSVGMRRTTRVFGARVLRSGRRLWSESSEGKHMNDDGDDWIDLLPNSENNNSNNVDTTRCSSKENGCHDDEMKQENSDIMEVEERTGEQTQLGEEGSVRDVAVDRMWGKVYHRKRKRQSSGSAGDCEKKKRTLEQRKYGIQFFRKHWRRRKNSDVLQGYERCRVLTAVVESSCSTSGGWFACFLNLILRYMTRTSLRLAQLFAFVNSEPLVLVFSTHGIRFLRDSTSFQSPGVCKIFGARCRTPLFSVDFSALPVCFTYLHSTMLLRSARLHVRVMYSVFIDRNKDVRTGDEEDLSCSSLCNKDSPGSKTITSGHSSIAKKRMLNQITGSPRLASRNVPFRNGVSSRGIQKKRSSLRSRRSRLPSTFGIRKTKGTLVADMFSYRREFLQLSPAASDRELRSSVRRRSPATNFKDLNTISPVGIMTLDHDSTSCSANVLIIESDKCYREIGAIIRLEISDSKQWHLAVKINGTTRYRLMAQKVMRPCGSNRFTHDKIWSEDNISGWKLEFPNRQDWFVFKELYRVCFERMVKAALTTDTIPVPGVHEVPEYAYSETVPFDRPDSYIKSNGDELSRALAKRSPNYDMDTEDELWLNKFNKEFFGENELDICVSEESFELIIDTFEKALYFSPEDYSDEQAAIRLCQDLESREVVEAVHAYWMKKRKLKRASLIRVFQLNQQPRRAQVIPKSVMRKKRSFKRPQTRKASKAGRVGVGVGGKQRGAFFRGGAGGMGKGKGKGKGKGVKVQDGGVVVVFDEERAKRKVEEAKEAASRSEGLAVVKRQEAQILMGNAELATYRATMALRIAEAVQVAESADAAASFFLH